MTNLRRQFLVYLLRLSDLMLLGLSLYLSEFGLAAITSWSVMEQKKIQVHTIIAIAVLFFAWRKALVLLGLYRSKRLARRLPEVVDLFKASALATILLAVVAVIFGIHTITLEILLRFLVLTVSCLIASHLAMRLALTIARRHGRNLRHVVVIGTNARAVRFADGLIGCPELGYRVVGFVDDAWFGPEPSVDAAANLLCSVADFRSFIRTHVIDEAVIALPIKSFYEQEEKLLQICREQGVIVRVLSDLFHDSNSSTEIDEADVSPVVSFYNTPADYVQLGAKRVVDIVISSLILVLFSPFMLVALILAKLDSEGPAIFTQERIGLNKRRFRMYKFRSMVANAEKLQAALEAHNEAHGPVFKIKHDPRITRVGRILRKTSIDELPQLFNVLKGDMSLVGPRPLPVRDYAGFREDWQRRRFSVRPGITCLWQVSGRSDISFDQWMNLDMEYIDCWSLWLDMKILARTIPVVVKGSGAS